VNALKSWIKSTLRRNGYELCQLYDSEKAEVPDHARMTYREAQCYRALGNMGQLSIVEARLLQELVRESDPARPIIEIGTLFGFSTLVMALAKQPGQRLITVDNYSWNPLGLSPDAHFATTRNRLAEVVREHGVEQRRVDKDAFYRGYDGPPPALFFCDADHEYEPTKADLLWARSVGATIICGDDYDHPYQKGTKQAVDELGGPRRLAGGLFVL
jgi:predicted O-methyltransferase YrrM